MAQKWEQDWEGEASALSGHFLEKALHGERDSDRNNHTHAHRDHGGKMKLLSMVNSHQTFDELKKKKKDKQQHNLNIIPGRGEHFFLFSIVQRCHQTSA